jgi:predicted phage terminase large subunit-like protein
VTQRGHPDDLSGHLLQKGGFKRIVIEAVASQDTNYDLDGGRVHFREKGSLIDPRRFGPQEIEERKRDLGSRGFEAQYQQNPLPPDGAIFKRDWLKIVDEVPQFEYVVISGDIAGSQGCGDYTSFLVWGYRHPTWHLIAAFRDQVDLPQGIELYRKLDQKFEPDVAVIEGNGLGLFFVQRLRELGYRHVLHTTVKGDKHIRAEAITPLLERGQVAILRSMNLYEAFMAELLAFPSSRYDDMVDAFTILLNKRESVLREAQRHRREIRKNLPIAPSQQLVIRITNFDWRPVRDRYFERTGRSVFD